MTVPESRPGRLLVVGTPIGNLGDITDRALHALRDADVIACEDTRRTGRLLQLLGVEKKPYLVANDHTEHRIAETITDRVLTGAKVALVSDAGMPGVSDPGERVIRAVIAAGLEVEIVPGPTALISALILSGLATDRFVFEGFLARKGRARAEQLADIATERRTTILYESPKRVMATLRDLAAACGGERQVSVARELTKLHEEVVRGTLDEVLASMSAREQRGEFVLVLAGASESSNELSDQQVIELVERHRTGGASTRDAVAAVVATTGIRKRRVYELANLPPTAE